MDKMLRGSNRSPSRPCSSTPLGPGGHLRRDRRLQGGQAEGHRQRQVLSGDGPMAPRPGDRRRADSLGALQLRSATPAIVPPACPRALPRPLPQGRRAADRSRARHRVRNRRQQVADSCRHGPRLRDDCTIQPTPLYLEPDQASSFTASPASGDAFDEYVSDPAKPVPFRARPIQPIGYDCALTWPHWLVDDQREASGRPDVLDLHLRCR